MTHSILIVDDQAVNLEVMRVIFNESDYNYRLYFAKNSEKAFELLDKYRIDLVLLDVILDEPLTGFDVCKAIKKNSNTARIPVIFTTGLNDVDDQVMGFECGCVDYIHKPYVAELVLKRVKAHLSLTNIDVLKQSYLEAVDMLGEAGHYNDTDTGMHIWRMASYSREVALASGWSEHDSEELFYAAALHDTGKIAIPTHILQKPGPLDDNEWAIMKTHTTIGMNILSRSKSSVFALASDIAGNHHEKYDGSGYPNGMSSNQISHAARIVALCDVFDALMSKRAYKKSWSLNETMSLILSESGKHFDPNVVDVFADNLDSILSLRHTWQLKEEAAAA